MHRWIAGLITLPLAAGPAAAASPTWVFGPDLPTPAGAVGSEWHDITATSATDIWAVGTVVTPTASAPLIGHSDGTSWTSVPAPTAPRVSRYQLTAVDAVADKDVWAVGTAVGTGNHTSALAMHYDGRSWTVPVDAIAPVTDSTLADVDLLTRDDGWAVGYLTTSSGGRQALVMHGAAGTFTRVPVPVGDFLSSQLEAVHARAADDVWAVGSKLRLDGEQGSLVLHYDGRQWQEVTVPRVGSPGERETLLAVAAYAPGDVWAVGTICQFPDLLESCRALALHLTAGGWAEVPTSGIGTELTAVIPHGPDDVWIIGYVSDQEANEFDMAEHWDGTRFSRDPELPLPAPGAGILDGEPGSALEAATGVPGTKGIWAAGWYRASVRGTSHIIHRD